MRLKILDPVVDVRKPGDVGRFQRAFERAGEQWAVVKFPYERAKVLPMRLILPAIPRRPYPKHRKSPRGTQASRAYNKLAELKGWSAEECRRRAKAVGLSVVQVLEAVLEE